jgi:putative aminopeptidase FrvX
MSEFLEAVLGTPGVAGREDRIRNVVAEEMRPLVDEMSVDVMGNLIGRLKPRRGKGEPLRVMVAAHMDQIGFYVRHIDDDGFIRFTTAGGFDPKTLIAQRIVVHGKKDLSGVIGSKPIHVMTDEEKKAPIKIENLYLDLGLAARSVKSQVAVGDPITLVGNLETVGNCWTSRAMDDRIGVYVAVEALRKVAAAKKGPAIDLYTVITVQEEVGLRGAFASAYTVNPHVGIALDVTLACDLPGVAPHEQISNLGKGVSISLMNGALISNPLLLERFKSLAKTKKVPFQLDILPRGGTDAGAMQRTRGGCAAITLSVPCRYVHSTVETVHQKDVKAAINLLAAYILDETSGKYAPKLPA